MTDSIDHTSELWKSVRNQGQAIIKLEANQEEMHNSLKIINQSLAALSNKITEATKVPWAAIGTGITVVIFLLSAFSGILFWAYSENLANVRDDVDYVEELLDELVPRQEHEARWEERRREIEGLSDRVSRLEDPYFKK